jgi:hypothetical protein
MPNVLIDALLAPAHFFLQLLSVIKRLLWCHARYIRQPVAAAPQRTRHGLAQRLKD